MGENNQMYCPVRNNHGAFGIAGADTKCSVEGAVFNHDRASHENDESLQNIHVVYACDDNYAMIAGVSMASLLEHWRGDAMVVFHILCCDVSEINKSRFRRIAEGYRCKIEFIDAGYALRQLSMGSIDVQRWSLAAYARLLTPDLLPDLDKILYLDCDTLVTDNVETLWQTEMGTSVCAAVSEPFSVLRKKDVRLARDDLYFNSGVMLIDLAKWRTQDLIHQFVKCIERHKGRVPYVDQGCINEVCRGNIKLLPLKNNVYTLFYDFTYEEAAAYRRERGVYTKEEVEQARKNPVVVHFTSSFLSTRPWFEGSLHPYAKEWERVLSETPWAGAEKWPYHPDAARRMLCSFYRHSPRGVGLLAAALVNSYIRPMLQR